MKIESCSIENFGKLSKAHFEFNDNLNIILKENGWGKSTLAAFIRAMFYGLENQGRRSEIENERKRFKPWQGGSFGGKLVFETKGVRYEITRTFGEKESNDTFELRNADTNLFSDRFSENIGEELFHINSESFMKTVFISQNDCASSETTDDINSRLGKISDTTDLNRFKAVDDKLTQMINELGPIRHGRLAILSKEIAEARKKVHDGERILDSIDSIEERIHGYETELNKLSYEQHVLNQRKIQAVADSKNNADRETYKGLLTEVEIKAAGVDDARARFHGKIPEDEVLDKWESDLVKISNLKAMAQGSVMTDAENAAYSELSRAFSEHPFEPSQNEDIIRDCLRFNELNSDRKKYALSDKEKEDILRYRRIFCNSAEPEGEVKSVMDKKCEVKRLSKEADGLYDDIKESEASIRALKKLSKRSGLTVTIFGVVLIIIALALFFLTNEPFIPGVDPRICEVALFPVGTLFFFVGIFKSSGSRELKTLEEDVHAKKGKYEGIISKIDGINDEIMAYLRSHGRNDDPEHFDSELQSLLSDAYLARSLFEKERDKGLHDHEEEISVLRTRISDYLSLYGVDSAEEMFLAELKGLEGNALRFEALDSKKRDLKRSEAEVETLREEIVKSLKDHSFEPSEELNWQIREIKEWVNEVNRAEGLYKDALARLDAFKETHAMDAVTSKDSSEDSISVSELELMQNELEVKKHYYEDLKNTEIRNLNGLREKYEEWLEDCEQFEKLSQESLDIKKKYDLYVTTKELLNEARENLTGRYTEPLQQGFEKYYRLITGMDATGYRLDANLDLTVDEAGVRRNTGLLSSAYKDLIGFCMRMAMADAMYKGEKPMLILDDPFVNLDDEKIRYASELLKLVSEQYQILYLTCREDRI